MGVTLLTRESGRNRIVQKGVRTGASLIELLVVLFIMGIMMGMLLPALQGARNRADAVVCENNVRQLHFALSHHIAVKKKFPVFARWTVDVLPWMEQRPLAEAIKYNANPEGKYPRPPLMQCPMQEDFFSRVETVGFCHYVLVVDRFPNGELENGWEIQDRQLLSDDVVEAPWYVGPEMTYAEQADLYAKRIGPHPSGLYMTSVGLRPE